MELFLLLPSFQSKNFFNTDYSIPFKDSDTCFGNRKQNYQNRKWNYLSYFLASKKKNFFNKVYSTEFKDSDTGFGNMKQNYSNRKWNYSSQFLASNKKTYFTKISLHHSRIQILILETGNRISKTGNYFSSFLDSNKKLHYQCLFYTIIGFRYWFWKQEIESFKQEMELVLLLLSFQSKIFFNTNYSTPFKDSDTCFGNRKQNY